MTIYKNGVEVWKQMFPNGEKGKFDVRMLAAQRDVIDVEIQDLTYTGYNYALWTCDVAEFLGIAPFCHTITSEGHSSISLKQFSLGSLVGATQGAAGVEYYSIKNDLKKPMNYNSSSKRWESPFAEGIGYISNTSVSPGAGSDTIMEANVTESGILRIYGDMKANEQGDGVVSKIYLNDELLWSSRVGGERAVRWDEPFDVSYFVNHVDVVANVQAGDKLTFSFNQWRKVTNDQVDITNVMLSYISGDVLSKTTKWKLKQSVIVDTDAKRIYRDGVSESVNIIVENGTAYIAKDDISKLFCDAQTVRTGKNVNGVQYLPLRDVSEDKGKVVVWASNRLVLLHEGIPVLFGYSELSEINVALEGGVLFD